MTEVFTSYVKNYCLDTIIKQDVMSKTHDREHNLSPVIFIGNQIIRE